MTKKKLLSLSLLLTFNACAISLKPTISLCTIDYPNNRALCASTNAPLVTSDVPLSSLNSGVAVTPEDWAKIQTYIQALEREVRKQLGD